MTVAGAARQLRRASRAADRWRLRSLRARFGPGEKRRVSRVRTVRDRARADSVTATDPSRTKSAA